MKFTEVFSYFFLEDTNDVKSFSMSRLSVFIGAIVSVIMTLLVGYMVIVNNTEHLTTMITFVLALWGFVFGGKALNRYVEKDVKK